MAVIPWVTVGDIPAAVRAKVTDEEVLTSATWMATETLYALTGRRWSGGPQTATVTLRWPCGAPDRYPPAVPPFVSSAMVAHNHWCGCADDRDLPLPDWPVTAVTSVTVAGESGPRAPASYLLVGGRKLRAVDTTWPVDVDITVVYTHGALPPTSGLLAAAALAGEIALSLAGLPCRLPRRVTSISRQGIDMVVLDPFELLDHGRTGIYEVDLFLAATNSRGLRRRPAVWSPDQPTAVRG